MFKVLYYKDGQYWRSSKHGTQSEAEKRTPRHSPERGKLK